MEKSTSEIFKVWQQCSAACQSVNHNAVAQRTAEDRVTAVDNELARTSLTRDVSVFSEDGKVVYDLEFLLQHLKGIKSFLDQGKHLEKRNKYGINSFVLFVQWLLKKQKLNTNVKILNFLKKGKSQKTKKSVRTKRTRKLKLELILDRMGASWFVSYAYHEHIDPKQNSWKNVTPKSLKSRARRYRSYVKMHRRFLLLVLKMNDAKIESNEIGLTAATVKRMASELLKII